MRELTKYILSPIALFAFVAAWTLTTLTGPFGTYVSMGLWERALYWFVLIGASLVISLIIRRYVDLRWTDRSFWTRAAITGTAFTLVFTPCIVGVNLLVHGEAGFDVMPIWMMYLIVASVPLTVNPMVYLVRSLAHQEMDQTPKARSQDAGDDRPRLFERLPDDLGEELIRLSVQDHFVHVYMADGREKLRMRFGDAMAEVEGVPGLRVHRSHWVAHRAVSGHVQEGGRVTLRLTDGSEVPVSRNYRAAVEAAGLLMDAPASVEAYSEKQERRSA